MGEKGKAEGSLRHGYADAPVIDGDHLVAGVGGANGAGVVCFDKLTGQVVWKAQDEQPGHSSPIIADVAGKAAVSSSSQLPASSAWTPPTASCCGACR